MLKMLLIALAIVAAFRAWPEGDSNQQQSREQEELLRQRNSDTGMPALTNFAERKMLRSILEERDKSPRTITYVLDDAGHLHKICDSIGYGVPAATQYTSPAYVASGGRIVPQADPNGLFSPVSSEGTWVMCLDSAKAARVVYLEPRVIVSPFPIAID